MPALLLFASRFFSILLLPFVLFLASNSASEEDTIVVTSSGPIKGKYLLSEAGSVIAYLGIPYAEPPLGKLRFQKPRPHQSWSQVLEATSFGNACPQFLASSMPDADMWAPNRPLSEDCLSLNVWVPHPRPSTPIPVLVWIHGGGYLAGVSSLDLYNGEFLAAREGVIVVSLNYRLGALGFLFLPPDAPGNMGLWDQQLALRWVKENAAVWGGDPHQVTIFGHSAGAALVGFHLFSPTSQPLFAHAVLQSGVPSAVWAWMKPEKAKQKTLDFSQRLGCMEGDASAVVRCLQEKDAALFSQHQSTMFVESKFLLDLPFAPTMVGDFFPEEPERLLETGQLQVKPTLIGITSDEASTFAPYLFPNTSDSLITWDQLLKAIKMTLRRATKDDIQAVALKYSERNQGPAKYRSAMSQALTDYFFICPAAEFAAKMQEAGSSVYVYSFTHHTSGSFWPEWIGATHGAELPYVFGTLPSVMAVNRTYTEAEAMLSHEIMRYWAEFARSGNPTGFQTSKVEWPLYNATQQNFFGLNIESSQIIQKSPALHCDFLKAHSMKAGKLHILEEVSPGEEAAGETSS